MINIEQIPVNIGEIDNAAIFDGMEENLQWFDGLDIGDEEDDEPTLPLDVFGAEILITLIRMML